MKLKSILIRILAVAFISMGLSVLTNGISYAHCDTLNGPVIKDGKVALNSGDVNPALKWVKKEREPEIKAAFDKALAERTKSEADKERADMAFFETLVRIHREGEGEIFTGLKPEGTPLSPVLISVEKSLEANSEDGLVTLIANNVASGIRSRFANTVEKNKHKDESVETGREFVDAYIELLRYAERLYSAAMAEAGEEEIKARHR